ncbi:MAG: ABC transporter ATP-binding protein [Anaerolineae bacterium]|nr:ABC transporter ATP-binding protein [Anaerolineae bacterium]
MSAAIQVNQLVHTFGERRAVNNLSFEVRHGEVFGLLGPNGAGKTTTVRLLNGLYKASQGSISVLGMNPADQGQHVRERTGVLTETPALYERLTARQNLEFFGRLAGMKEADLAARIDELLTFFELKDRAGDKAGTYSKGMKQRLALARALLHRPEVIFLDEPTSGLDPESSQQVRDLIDSVRHHNGTTVFLCTHMLTEAERLCDRVAILNQGRVLDMGSQAELQQRLNPGQWIDFGFYRPLPHGVSLAGLPGVMTARGDGLEWELRVESSAVVPALVNQLSQAGAQILRVQPRKASLEEIYFALQQQADEVQS